MAGRRRQAWCTLSRCCLLLLLVGAGVQIWSEKWWQTVIAGPPSKLPTFDHDLPVVTEHGDSTRKSQHDVAAKRPTLPRTVQTVKNDRTTDYADARSIPATTTLEARKETKGITEKEENEHMNDKVKANIRVESKEGDDEEFQQPSLTEGSPQQSTDVSSSAGWVLVAKADEGVSSGCNSVDAPMSPGAIVKDCQRVAQANGANIVNFRQSDGACYAKVCSSADSELTRKYGGWDVWKYDKSIPAGRSAALVVGGEPSLQFKRPSLETTNSGGVVCPTDLKDFRSKSAMLAAGWVINMETTNFGNKFLGWSGGMVEGSLRVKFKRFGRAQFEVENVFEPIDPNNIVRVRVNGLVAEEVPRHGKAKVCINFSPGDVLEVIEVYSQMRVGDFSLKCSDDDTLHRLAESSVVPPSGGTSCLPKQKIWVKQRWRCDEKKGWQQGIVEKALNETTAVVQFGSGGQLSIFSTPKDQLIPDRQNPEIYCTDFGFKRWPIGIVILADKQFQRTYAVQIAANQCFAKKRGYDFWIIEGHEYNRCGRFRDFFFKKHCMVAQFLDERPADYVVVILDADVIPVTHERGFEQWVGFEGDVQFYERAASEEIAAGNYIARNTRFAKDFLMGWADFERQRPKGYSSSDNGAIHVHILEVLGLSGAKKCRQVYSALKSYEPGGPEYFDFVKCSKKVLGFPRAWKSADGKGVLTLWPRMQFFVVDGFFVNKFSSHALGPVMHHGIKDPYVVKSHYYDGSITASSCQFHKRIFKDSLSFSDQVIGFARAYKHLYPQGSRCKQCIENCFRTLSCHPLKADEDSPPE